MYIPLSSPENFVVENPWVNHETTTAYISYVDDRHVTVEGRFKLRWVSKFDYTGSAGATISKAVAAAEKFGDIHKKRANRGKPFTVHTPGHGKPSILPGWGIVSGNLQSVMHIGDATTEDVQTVLDFMLQQENVRAIVFVQGEKWIGVGKFARPSTFVSVV